MLNSNEEFEYFYSNGKPIFEEYRNKEHFFLPNAYDEG